MGRFRPHLLETKHRCKKALLVRNTGLCPVRGALLLRPRIRTKQQSINGTTGNKLQTCRVPPLAA